VFINLTIPSLMRAQMYWSDIFNM